MKVAVVDDHSVFAEALASRLDLEPDLDAFALPFVRQQLLEVLEDSTIDLVLMDYDLGMSPGFTGLTLGEEVLRRRPEVRIVIVSCRTEDDAVVEGARMGMSGWVPKDASIDLLLDVIRGARRGETYIPGRLLTRVLKLLAQASDANHGSEPAVRGLTPREVDVLRCMVDGMSRAEIADRLHLSQNTVRTHVQRVLHKFGVHSSLSAVARAREAGVLGVGSFSSNPTY